MKKAIIAASFGTSHPEADAQCILPVEAALKAAYPDSAVRRAFTSAAIIEKLRMSGEEIESIPEVIDRLESEGFDSISIVSTHIVRGDAYSQLKAAAKGLPISSPLLDTDEDCLWMTGLLSGIAEEEGQSLLVMGHGVGSEADDIYARLKQKLPGNVFLACIKGNISLDSILSELDVLPEKKITLMPLMLTAGDHARKILAGNNPVSWKSTLENRGFEVRIRMRGLGALPDVQKRFIEKARKMENRQDFS